MVIVGADVVALDAFGCCARDDTEAEVEAEVEVEVKVGAVPRVVVCVAGKPGQQ